MLTVNLVLLVLVGTVLGKDWKTERMEELEALVNQLGPWSCCGIQCGEGTGRFGWPRTHGCAQRPYSLPLLNSGKRGKPDGNVNAPFQCIKNPCLPKNPCPSKKPFCVNIPKYCLPGKKCPAQHECHVRH